MWSAGKAAGRNRLAEKPPEPSCTCSMLAGWPPLICRATPPRGQEAAAAERAVPPTRARVCGPWTPSTTLRARVPTERNRSHRRWLPAVGSAAPRVLLGCDGPARRPPRVAPPLVGLRASCGPRNGPRGGPSGAPDLHAGAPPRPGRPRPPAMPAESPRRAPGPWRRRRHRPQPPQQWSRRPGARRRPKRSRCSAGPPRGHLRPGPGRRASSVQHVGARGAPLPQQRHAVPQRGAPLAHRTPLRAEQRSVRRSAHPPQPRRGSASGQRPHAQTAPGSHATATQRHLPRARACRQQPPAREARPSRHRAPW
mmetsp:Transcript_48621/g.128238  ORF Transcript_48621/g.128238 Transcript_48621/m.128238 type:complete len:310 (-) Transcript_48621:20-949(-)